MSYQTVTASLSMPRITSRHRVWLGVLIVLVVAAALGFHYFDAIQGWMDDNREAIEDFFKPFRSSWWAPVIVWGVYIAAGLACFPATVISLAVAAVFGFMGGVFYGLTGALLSATLLFWIGQKAGDARIKKLLPKSVSKFDKKLGKSGIAGMAMLRMVVFAPFTLFNLVMGVSSVKYRDFIIGSFIGLLPGFIARGMVGDSLMQILINPTWKNSSYLLGGVVLWVVLLFGTKAALEFWEGHQKKGA